MVYKRKGLPEEGELVICTVKKVLYHSVFVTLDEFLYKEGMIHISEIAPGRIRNIRDYVREGKQVVCKVLAINMERGTIDLSLRRVSLQLRLKKEEEFKQELKAEKILEQAAKKLKMGLKDIYIKIGQQVTDTYGSFSACFLEIVAKGKSVLDELKVPEDIAKEIANLVKEKIKIPKVSIAGKLALESFEEDGIEKIKDAIKKGEEFAKKNNINIKITYMGAPNYLLELIAGNYKEAEKSVDKVVNVIVEEIQKSKGKGSFKRED